MVEFHSNPKMHLIDTRRRNVFKSFDSILFIPEQSKNFHNQVGIQFSKPLSNLL